MKLTTMTSVNAKCFKGISGFTPIPTHPAVISHLCLPGPAGETRNSKPGSILTVFGTPGE